MGMPGFLGIGDRSDLPDCPWVINATSQYPAEIAAMACAMWITKEDPPTEVLSVNLGFIPMYSATSSDDQPAVKKASISVIDIPASRQALCAASECKASGDLSGTFPMESDSATPTISQLPDNLFRRGILAISIALENNSLVIVTDFLRFLLLYLHDVSLLAPCSTQGQIESASTRNCAD